MSEDQNQKSVGELRLERAQKAAQEAAEARADFVTEEQERDARTLRLRALRLEKEQRDAEAAASKPPAPAAVRKPKTVRRARIRS